MYMCLGGELRITKRSQAHGVTMSRRSSSTYRFATISFMKPCRHFFTGATYTPSRPTPADLEAHGIIGRTSACATNFYDPSCVR